MPGMRNLRMRPLERRDRDIVESPFDARQDGESFRRKIHRQARQRWMILVARNQLSHHAEHRFLDARVQRIVVRSHAARRWISLPP